MATQLKYGQLTMWAANDVPAAIGDYVVETPRVAKKSGKTTAATLTLLARSAKDAGKDTFAKRTSLTGAALDAFISDRVAEFHSACEQKRAALMSTGRYVTSKFTGRANGDVIQVLTLKKHAGAAQPMTPEAALATLGIDKSNPLYAMLLAQAQAKPTINV